MNRELRFRAFDTAEKRWLFGYEYPNLGGFHLKGETILCGEFGGIKLEKMLKDIEITQYIGLNDKDGKPVYEGDILSKPDTRLFNWLVEFKEGCFVIVNIGVNGHLGERFKVDASTFIDREIIGNVFETPELLNSPSA